MRRLPPAARMRAIAADGSSAADRTTPSPAPSTAGRATLASVTVFERDRSCSNTFTCSAANFSSSRFEVGLVVEAERPVVEVGRADRDEPAVDHQHLAVEHRRLVFGDLHARLEQRPPVGRARRARTTLESMIGPGTIDAHLHPALRGLGQGADRQLVGHEVAVRELDARLRRGDRRAGTSGACSRRRRSASC